MRHPLPLSALFLLACAGGDDDGTTTAATGVPMDCGADIEQLPSGATAPVPTGQEGALADVLPGVWQHTWIVQDGRADNPVSDDVSDLRFAIDEDLDTFVYCQGVDVASGNNSSSLSVEGTKLAIQGAGYTAEAWTRDTMLWRNDFFDDRDEYFVLERLF